MKLYSEIEKNFSQLKTLLKHEDLLTLKNTDYNALYLYHFDLGLWIRNHLLNEDELLYQSFLTHKIDNKDDMSSLIIALFYLWCLEN